MCNRLIILSFIFSGFVFGSMPHGVPNLEGSHPDYLFEKLFGSQSAKDSLSLENLSPRVKDVVGMLAQMPRGKNAQRQDLGQALTELKTIAGLFGKSIDALVDDFKEIANDMKGEAQWLKDYGPSEAHVVRYLVAMANGQQIELSELMGNLKTMADKIGQSLPYVVKALREISRITKEDENSVLWSTHENAGFNFKLFVNLLSLARQTNVEVREFLSQWDKIAVAMGRDWSQLFQSLREIALSLGRGKNEVDAITYLYDLSNKSGLSLLELMKTLAEVAASKYGKDISMVLLELEAIAKTLNQDAGGLLKDLVSISGKFKKGIVAMLAEWDGIAKFGGLLAGLKNFAQLAKSSYKTLPDLMTDLVKLGEGRELSSAVVHLEDIAKKSEQSLQDLILSLSKAALATGQDLPTLMKTLKAMGSLSNKDVGEVILELNNTALSEGRTTFQAVFSELVNMAEKNQMTLPALAKGLSDIDASQRKISNALDTLQSMANIAGLNRSDFILDLKTMIKNSNETFAEFLRNLGFKYGEENLLAQMKTWQSKARQDTKSWSEYMGGLAGFGRKPSKNWLEWVKSRLEQDPTKSVYQVLDTL